jgi:hypothetical protein
VAGAMEPPRLNGRRWRRRRLCQEVVFFLYIYIYLCVYTFWFLGVFFCIQYCSKKSKDLFQMGITVLQEYIVQCSAVRAYMCVSLMSLEYRMSGFHIVGGEWID